MSKRTSDTSEIVGGYDESNEDDEDSIDDFVELDEHTLLLLRNNDPSIANLMLGISFGHSEIGEFDPHDVDWTREADSIANNTHLKSLNVDGFMRHRDESTRASTEANVKAFYSAIAQNRSIKHLCVDGCRLIDVKDLLTILLPFFQNNNNLRSFQIANFQRSPDSIKILSLALSKTKHGCLRKFGLHGRGEISDQLEAKLLYALNGLHNLKKLSLGSNLFGSGREWCVALGDLLNNPNTKLEELDISWNSMDDVGASEFAKHLANSKLKSLSMCRSNGITSAGWVAFFEQLHHLQQSKCAIKELHLDGNHIDDDGINSMLLALPSLRSLKVLSLEENNTITTSGWKAFSRILEHSTSIETLNLKFNRSFNDSCSLECAQALRNNKSLRIFHLPDQANTAGFWIILTCILCRITGIEGAFESNHTLEDIGGDERLIDPELLSLLQLNRGTNKFEVARQKIIKHYIFPDGKPYIKKLIDMKIGVLPHLIAWAGRDGTGFPLVYHLFRALPSLFELDCKQQQHHQQHKCVFGGDK